MVYVDPPQSPAWHVHPRFCLFPVSLSLPALSLSLSLSLFAFVFLLLFISFISLFFISFLCISSRLYCYLSLIPGFSPSCPSEVTCSGLLTTHPFLRLFALFLFFSLPLFLLSPSYNYLLYSLLHSAVVCFFCPLCVPEAPVI